MTSASTVTSREQRVGQKPKAWHYGLTARTWAHQNSEPSAGGIKSSHLELTSVAVVAFQDPLPQSDVFRACWRSATDLCSCSTARCCAAARRLGPDVGRKGPDGIPPPQVDQAPVTDRSLMACTLRGLSHNSLTCKLGHDQWGLAQPAPELLSACERPSRYLPPLWARGQPMTIGDASGSPVDAHSRIARAPGSDWRTSEVTLPCCDKSLCCKLGQPRHLP